jgi:hypothetical protein
MPVLNCVWSIHFPYEFALQIIMEFRVVALSNLNILMYNLVIFFFLEGKYEGAEL